MDPRIADYIRATVTGVCYAPLLGQLAGGAQQ